MIILILILLSMYKLSKSSSFPTNIVKICHSFFSGI